MSESTERLNPVEKIIESARALTNNKTIYGAYRQIKAINKGPVKPITPVPTSGAIGGIAGTAGAGAARAAAIGATGTPSDVANVGVSSGAAQSRTSIEALNKIHNDLIHMNVTVEKISAFTALLVRNSSTSLANQNLSNANDSARINEREINTQGSGEGHEGVSKKAKKEGGSSLLGSVANGAAEGLGRGAISGIGRGLGYIARAGLGLAATPVGAAVGFGIVTATALKVVSNWILDFPDGPAKDLVKKLIAKKTISWGLTDKYPKIEDVSYLRSLPKEQIALLIDSGKFSGQDLGALKVILHEPQVKTKVPATQIQPKTKIIAPVVEPTEHKEPDLKNDTITNFGPSFDNTQPVIADDLQTKIVTDETIAKKPTIEIKAPSNPRLELEGEGEGFNAIESTPEIQIPITKGKDRNLNFGVVAIKSLNIQELILPDDSSAGLFGGNKEDKKGFFDEMGESISKRWEKIKDFGKSLTEPHDQGELRRQKAKSEETAYDKASGKYGSDTDAKTATKILMDKGWTKEQASGIAANLNAESKFNTKAVGDNGQAQGIAQWHPDRQKKFEELSGKKVGDATFEEQVNFVDWELKNSEKKAGEKIKATKTASEAAAATEQHYERSKLGGQGGVQQQRIEDAERYAKMDIGTPENQQVASTEVSKKNDTGTAYVPYVEPQKTATLEKQQTQSSGNILADTQTTQSQVTKAPDLSVDNLQRIADQTNKPQQPIVVQAPAAPTQQQKPTTAPIMAVRDDSPMILNMQYGNLRV